MRCTTQRTKDLKCSWTCGNATQGNKIFILLVSGLSTTRAGSQYVGHQVSRSRPRGRSTEHREATTRDLHKHRGNIQEQTQRNLLRTKEGLLPPKTTQKGRTGPRPLWDECPHRTWNLGGRRLTDPSLRVCATTTTVDDTQQDDGRDSWHDTTSDGKHTCRDQAYTTWRVSLTGPGFLQGGPTLSSRLYGGRRGFCISLHPNLPTRMGY